MQVREQEKEFARINRQAYEHRLSQERKRLYAELLQKWDKQQQVEMQSLQDAYQRVLDEASAAQVTLLQHMYCQSMASDFSPKLPPALAGTADTEQNANYIL